MANHGSNPPVTEADSALHHFLALGRMCLSEWRLALPVLALMALQVAYNIFIPLGNRILFDRAIPQKDSHLAIIVLSAMAAALVLRMGIVLGQERLTARLGTDVASQLRSRLFGKLHQLPYQYFFATPSGEINSLFSGDLSTTENAVVRILPRVVYMGLNLLGCVVCLFLVDWRLALLTTAALGASLLAPRLLGARAAQAGRTRREAEARLFSLVQETVGAQGVLRAFGLQGWSSERFEAGLTDYRGRNVTSVLMGALLESSAILSTGFVLVLTMAVGAGLAITGSVSLGTLFAFTGLMATVGNSTFGLSAIIPSFVDATVCLQRIQQFAKLSEMTEQAESTPLPRLGQAIRLDDVTFSYSGDKPNLKHVSLEIPAGSSAAFVGPSGSGKSTILSLLLRYYDPQSGAVRLDGRDLQTASMKSFRDQLAVVPQEPLLFDLSVRENIRLGRLEATEAEIIEAARQAELHEIILKLPQGYDSPVGERGGRLSGGQRQRLAIARAILRNPAILLLDEATSALDPETEATINKTLEKLGKSRTVISVTHRLHSVVNTDRIFVVDGGEIREWGTHQQLLAKNGLYRTLWDKQNGFTPSREGQDLRIAPERLAAIPLFKDVDRAFLAPLADYFSTIRVEPGKSIFEAGDAGDFFYILARGRADVIVGQGASAHAIPRSDGDYFGELALLDDKPRTASVRAVTHCTLLALSRQHFRDLLDNHPSVAKAIGETAEARRKALAAERVAA